MSAGLTTIHTTKDAAWLPPGSHADVVEGALPPSPMCVVRLLVRDAHRVFCVPRLDAAGKMDLPMRVVDAGDSHGDDAIRELSRVVLGRAASPRFIGAVRNVVRRREAGYAWPVPYAFFGVWEAQGVPQCPGTWLAAGGRDSQLAERHWYPLL